MPRLFLLLFLVEIALAAAALISCLSTEEGDIRALPRIVWVILIVLFPIIGSIAWFIAGKPPKTAPKREPGRPGNGVPEKERPRPVAPDDDPEFLRSLNARDNSRDDKELMRRWEEDLRRREEELRRERGEDGETGRNDAPRP